MVRLIAPVLMALAVAGCSLGSQPLSFGFNAQPSAGRSNVNFASRLGDESVPASRSRQDRMASLDITPKTAAPSGRASDKPASPLDRDFSATSLNVEAARVLINAYRHQNGLKPVTLNAELTKAAKAHARDLAKWDRISHYGSDGSTPWDRVKRSGYNAKVAAENVGTGQVTFQEVLAGWKASPGHNKNLLLAEARNIGLALVHDPKTEFKTFWTLVVASPI